MSQATNSELFDLLNDALNRELQVSVQYMLQHAIGAAHASKTHGKTPSAAQDKFVASHSWYLLPGATLKKFAIAEMRHAEAIAERLVVLGRALPTQTPAITLGKTAQQMLENDRGKEREAIELYTRIIDVAGKEHDDVTADLFRQILSDEEKHLLVFSNLLGQ